MSSDLVCGQSLSHSQTLRMGSVLQGRCIPSPESYSKKALAWQVPRKTAEIWQLWSLVDQTLYMDDAHSPRAHLCVPRNNPNPHTHWKELLREGDHQQDVSAGETCAPLREWLAEVWAVEQVLFPNVLQLH